MRAVLVLFDSLNRDALGCYGGTAIPTPNFDRLAARGITFDNHFAGSLPCMPARRDLHTGRLNFMHRSWGPLEPFDNSMPELLKASGVYTHLITDHFHYMEDGGATYHNRYSSWELIRGQEYDPWAAAVDRSDAHLSQRYSPKHYGGSEAHRTQSQFNREKIRTEEDFPGPKCFASALEFLEQNKDADNWLLQLECFDPHEPFAAPERFKRRFPTDYDGAVIDWPRYGLVSESDAEIAEIKANYAALVSMCDEYLGTLLDYFDTHDLWRDTALLLTTDHGFLLSEHQLWGKNLTPYYDELVRLPLIVHHPGWVDRAGSRQDMITQTPDIMPTLLELFERPVPQETGFPSIQSRIDAPDDGRTAVFGMFGGPIGVADKNYRYLLYPPDLDDESLFEYTLMPTHMHGFFLPEEIKTAQLYGPLDFTKGMPLLRTKALLKAKRPPGGNREVFKSFSTMLFDVRSDPDQSTPLDRPEEARRLLNAIATVLHQHDATPDFFRWMGIDATPSAHSSRYWEIL